MKDGWDFGWDIGEWGADTFVDTEAFVDSAMTREYGTTDLTVEQATEFSARYDGWSGFRDFVTDGAQNVGSAIVDKLKFW